MLVPMFHIGGNGGCLLTRMSSFILVSRRSSFSF